MMGFQRKKKDMLVGLVDADLIDGGTRHPNLALLKIAGFLYENQVKFELITDPDCDIRRYQHIYMSKVFTFTKEPRFYTEATTKQKQKFHIGGTGYYANEKRTKVFKEKREKDMGQLERDPFLSTLTNTLGSKGILMARQMPYYDLYKEYIEEQVELGVNRNRFKDYERYSIGFLTRRCVRHCPFCVNRLENGVIKYSKLEWFYDKSRPYVYFWDDNFFAADYKVWKPILQKLIDERVVFQFRQGLDERKFAEDEHGEEMAEMLSRARYHGDYIFAFDNWKDRPIIEKALKVWKKYNPKAWTKFYLFCGFKQREDDKDAFYRDYWELFQRIKLLMQYRCVGYVMRHEDYRQSPIPNIYVQIARWCNQQQFYKKMSFWEYLYRNQSYWEEHTLPPSTRPHLMSFEAFEADLKAGLYDVNGGSIKLCLPLRSFLKMLEMFPSHRTEILEMANYKMSTLVNPQLWEKHL
ncbi:MAG: hypothetical protein MJ056_00070 [Akkermansia sp.]|nr:hypothetical protein [Akkermansia sp.]